VRYEPESTDLLASMQLPANASDLQKLQAAEARADQLMLSGSTLVPHCSEFIVEWSFGQVDDKGQTIWFGLDHLQVQGLAGIEQALIVGLVFGTIYARTGRLWLLIVAHAAFDLAALAIIYWDVEAQVAAYVLG
jgi:hypothetical protein